MDVTQSQPIMAEEDINQGSQDQQRRTLNFLVNPNEDFEPPMKKIRQARDPQSHRIIEKRRRDRMNNCLADLSQLIPSPYLKQGQGRIEKTEIIEMAIKHIKHLRSLIPEGDRPTLENTCLKREEIPTGTRVLKTEDACNMCEEKFFMGYKEGGDEVMRFLVEVQGYAASDPLCKSLLKHLRKQSVKFVPSSTEGGQQEALHLAENELYSTQTSNDSGMYSDKLVGHYAEDLRTDNSSRTGEENTTNDSNYGSMSSRYSLFTDNMENSANPEQNSDRRSSVEKNMSAYKYKNDIKSRFNADLTSTSSCRNSSSDSMSNSSRESLGRPMDKLSRLSMGQAISPNDSPDSIFSQYPRSDSSVVGSAGQLMRSDTASMSSGNGNSNELSPKSRCSASPPGLDMTSAASANRNSHSTFTPVQLPSSPETVPAFALHPTGMHYIPIVMHTHALHSHLSSDSRLNSNGPCHLISIPVSFGAPVINIDHSSDVHLTTAVNDSQQRNNGMVRNQPAFSKGNSSSRHASRRSREYSSNKAIYNNSSINSSYVNGPSRSHYPMDLMQTAVNPMSA